MAFICTKGKGIFQRQKKLGHARNLFFFFFEKETARAMQLDEPPEVIVKRVREEKGWLFLWTIENGEPKGILLFSVGWPSIIEVWEGWIRISKTDHRKEIKVRKTDHFCIHFNQSKLSKQLSGV